LPVRSRWTRRRKVASSATAGTGTPGAAPRASAASTFSAVSAGAGGPAPARRVTKTRATSDREIGRTGAIATNLGETGTGGVGRWAAKNDVKAVRASHQRKTRDQADRTRRRMLREYTFSPDVSGEFTSLGPNLIGDSGMSTEFDPTGSTRAGSRSRSTSLPRAWDRAGVAVVLQRAGSASQRTRNSIRSRSFSRGTTSK
jgi:hypothetical protein